MCIFKFVSEKPECQGTPVAHIAGGMLAINQESNIGSRSIQYNGKPQGKRRDPYIHIYKPLSDPDFSVCYISKCLNSNMIVYWSANGD